LHENASDKNMQALSRDDFSFATELPRMSEQNGTFLMIKSWIRQSVVNMKKISCAPFRKTIIVAGLGRCGTTLLFESLSYHLRIQPGRLHIVRLDDHIDEGLYYTPDTIDRGFDSLEYERLRGQFKRGHVYKSHDFPPEYLPRHVKVIYLFGNPVEIVLSAKSLDNDQLHGVDSRFTILDLHIRNLRGDFAEKGSLFEKDVLRLKDNFDLWMKNHSFPVMAVRYEALWDRLEDIRKFTGCRKLILPPYSPRKDRTISYDEKTLKSLTTVYQTLSRKIKDMSDVTVFE
jgi:hypothetical protein|tara:strand:+ start:2255 stop:3115 length:861 start_codon:yes stop_codon:yes gene_type:complete